MKAHEIGRKTALLVRCRKLTGESLNYSLKAINCLELKRKIGRNGVAHCDRSARMWN